MLSISMRPIIAALVAIAVLCAVDGAFNDGKFTGVFRQMISSLSGGRI